MTAPTRTPAEAVLAEAMAHARREVPELVPYTRGLLADVGRDTTVAGLAVELIHRYGHDVTLHRLAAVAAEAVVRAVAAEREVAWQTGRRRELTAADRADIADDAAAVRRADV